MHEALRDTVAALTRDLGLSGEVRLGAPLGGGNHRVHACDVGDQRLIVKQYHRADDDPRDRLSAEFQFAQFAWQSGVQCIAEPLIVDPQCEVALFRRIDGEAIRAEQIDGGKIDAAADFVIAVNRDRDTPTARALPFAAEACFSLADHLDLIAARVKRLDAIGAVTAIDADAGRLVRERIQPAWRDLNAAPTSPPAARVIRCLSPSDFGFHNALVERGDPMPSGRLMFFDFEHAGWDDPAKLVLDFFLQVAVPVPQVWQRRFMTRLAAGMEVDDGFADRVGALHRAYRIKWCCIALNPFLAAGERRRAFVDAECDIESLKADRLRIAEELLDGLR